MRISHLLSFVALALVAIVVYTWWTFDGFSARSQPSAVERGIARAVRRLAIPTRAREARNPVAFSAEVWEESRVHFADHCATCHANDGSGQTELGQNLYPKAPDMRLSDTQRLSDGELYWIIENGIRLTGMPAWGRGDGNDSDTWKMVHFIRHLTELTDEHLESMKPFNPTTRAELDEEREDDAFLAGEDIRPPARSGHVH
jgi:mono/diheme cytochrome c family protein